MERAQLRRFTFGLLFLTIAYNVVEGLIAIWAGLSAGSLVLLTFGADSYLEVLAAAVVTWRLSTQDEEQGERVERRAMRIVGATFLVLAAAVVFQSLLSIYESDGSETSYLGLGLLVASLVVMPILALAKLWTAAELDMPVLAAEAKETVACSYLSVTALAGLLATALLGFWWLDAGAALLMTPWLVKEGLEGVRGDACFEGVRPCFCRPCWYGLRTCTDAV